MAEFIVRPASTYINGWSVSPSGNWYDAVDEASANGDTDYIYTSASTQFAMDGNGATSMPTQYGINSVRIKGNGYVAAAGISQGVRGRLRMGNPGSNRDFTANALTTSYADFSTNEMLVNPATSNAWTEAEIEGSGSYYIDAWGLQSVNLGGSTQCRITQFYLSVDYNDAPVGGSVRQPSIGAGIGRGVGGGIR